MLLPYPLEDKEVICEISTGVESDGDGEGGRAYQMLRPEIMNGSRPAEHLHINHLTRTPLFFPKKFIIYYHIFSNLWLVSTIPFNKLHKFERIFTPSLRIIAMLRGVALLGGTPPEVLATLPREEELPLTDRQDRVGIKEVAQIAVPREHIQQWTVRWFFHKSSQMRLVVSQQETIKSTDKFNMWLPNWMFVSPGLTAPSSRSHPSERPAVVGFQTCFCWEMIQFSPNKIN